ncbi:MAG TPA: acetylglutamate kinase [Bryobacteraceae bacterium]|nr:acetylglutamate kinase [Bryobacteraceae bacterium]
MKVLIKLGGSLLDESESRARIAAEIVEVAREYETVVVHGGGKQLTRYLEAQGIKSRFVNGMRVSDSAVIDGVAKVIAGSVNKSLVATITALGEAAVGLSGVDGSLTSAVQLSPEMEFVGKPVKTDARLLDLLVNSGYLPVVACIAGDSKGTIFNVNADQMAVSCAAGWRAGKLIFLTDVPGVKDASGTVAPNLNTDQIRGLISAGVAHGGMQAKLEAAISALACGLEEVIIASGTEPDVCRRLLAGEGIGTRLSAAAEALRS